MRTQFLREESFSHKGGKAGRKGPRKVKRKTPKPPQFSAEEILAELEREKKKNCRHVPRPLAPLFIAGETKGIPKAIAYPHRWDTRVLLGAVASWPERWDQCDPRQVAEWSIAVRQYAEALWGPKIAAIVMHVDEAHPHIHIIVHDCGRSVKPLSPGFAAGDSAYEAAKAAGVKPRDANRIRHAEYRRAQALWLDHYHLHVGARFGMARKSLIPRPRGPRVSALEQRGVREWDDPLDLSMAAANGQVIRELLDGEIDRQLPRSSAPTVNVLFSIGFTPERDYHALAERLQYEDVYADIHSAAVPIQRTLLKILAAKPDWVEFVRQCQAHEVDLLFRWDASRVIGITFRQSGRAFPGSKLGRRFAWPRLSHELAFDPTNRAHMAALTEANLRAGMATVVLEPQGDSDAKPSPAKGKRPYPRPVPLVAEQVGEGVAYCWPSGRPAILERERALVIVDTGPDVLAFAIMAALKRGWTALRLSGPAKVLKHCASVAMEMAKGLGIPLVVRDPAPKQANGNQAADMPPRGSEAVLTDVNSKAEASEPDTHEPRKGPRRK